MPLISSNTGLAHYPHLRAHRPNLLFTRTPVGDTACGVHPDALPMPFSTIIGHAPIVSLLTHAVRRGSVPQSLLFAGPDGVGKRTAAIALAQAVNCPNRKDGDGCGRCPTCDRIARGQHSDVTIVTKGDEASIKIKTLRERVLESVGYRPFEAVAARLHHRPGRRPDDRSAGRAAQDARGAAALDDDRPRSRRIRTRCCPTIRSRCHRVTFGLLSEADVARVLVDVVRLAGGRRAQARVRLGRQRGAGARRTRRTSRRRPRGGLDARRLGQPRRHSGPAQSGHGARPARIQAPRSRSARRAARHRRHRSCAIWASCDRRAPRRWPMAISTTGCANSSPAFDVPRAHHRVRGRASKRGASLDRNASPKIVADWLSVKI